MTSDANYVDKAIMSTRNDIERCTAHNVVLTDTTDIKKSLPVADQLHSGTRRDQ